LEAAKALATAQEPVFNSLLEGTVLIAQRRKAFADPRLEVLPPSRFTEMLEIARMKRPLPDRFQSVFLSLDSPLAGKLAMTDGWRVLGIDACGIVITKDAGQRADAGRVTGMAMELLPKDLPAFSWMRVARSPIPYRRVAAFLRNMGKAKEAEEMLSIARRIYPRG
jgi:hypothetical protein